MALVDHSPGCSVRLSCLRPSRRPSGWQVQASSLFQGATGTCAWACLPDASAANNAPSPPSHCSHLLRIFQGPLLSSSSLSLPDKHAHLRLDALLSRRGIVRLHYGDSKHDSYHLASQSCRLCFFPPRSSIETSFQRRASLQSTRFTSSSRLTFSVLHRISSTVPKISLPLPLFLYHKTRLSTLQQKQTKNNICAT